MDKLIELTIIIPCRNEEMFIARCLDSIINNGYPVDRLEIIVVDGMSDDGTRQIVKDYSDMYPFIKFHNNPKKIVPTAMNIGIQSSCGQIIMRMDAHTIYERDYIEKCLRYLREYNAENVGGLCITLPGNKTRIAESIARALSHPFGVGNSYFRIGLREPKHVDTVPFGCYHKSIFDRIGLFNENLVRNQDIEINLRLKKSGGKILLLPDIISYYHARCTLKALAKNNFWNGYWVVFSTKFAKMPFSIRHLVPLSFTLSVLLSLLLSFFIKQFLLLFAFIVGLYMLVNISFSLKVAFSSDWTIFPSLLATFATLHFSYGLGSLYGTYKLVFRK